MPSKIAWQRRGLTLVAVVVPIVEPPPHPLDGPTFAKMIACPTCRVRVDQHCKTRSGRHREAHSSRIIPRRCSCGEPLARDKKVCDECRAAARRESGRRGMQATRARRKAAA